MSAITNFFSIAFKEIYRINVSLFKIMIPTLIIVKILEELGAISYLSAFLAPVMQLVGLPEEAAIVWAGTILTTTYTGMVLFFNAFQDNPLTVAQTTVLATMMLMAHSLPIELAITRKAGLRLFYGFVLRMSAGLLSGVFLYYFYSSFDLLQGETQLIWSPTKSEDGLLSWILSQLESFIYIFIIISLLVFGLKILRLIGIESLLIWLLNPFLKLIGISKNAASFTLVGVTLGVSFGGGLLIEEAKKGHIEKKDMFLSLSLLCICHSLIEDTLLMVVLGGDLTGILLFRLLFSFIAMLLIVRLYNALSDKNRQKYLITSVATDTSK